MPANHNFMSKNTQCSLSSHNLFPIILFIQSTSFFQGDQKFTLYLEILFVQAFSSLKFFLSDQSYQLPQQMYNNFYLLQVNQYLILDLSYKIVRVYLLPIFQRVIQCNLKDWLLYKIVLKFYFAWTLYLIKFSMLVLNFLGGSISWLYFSLYSISIQNCNSTIVLYLENKTYQALETYGKLVKKCFSYWFDGNFKMYQTLCWSKFYIWG